MRLLMAVCWQKNMVNPIRLFLYGAIDENNSKEIISAIYACNGAPEEEKPPFIELHINSQGGAVYYAMAVIAAMRKSSIPIHTICSGNAASCAAHIFIEGAKGRRYMHADATLMFHSGILSYDSVSVNVLNAERAHNDFIESYFNRQFMDNCIIQDAGYIEKEFMSHVPRYVYADEALEHLLCDVVVKESAISFEEAKEIAEERIMTALERIGLVEDVK